MFENGEYVKFKNYESKRKSPFTIYADFESTIVLEDNGKKNEIESNGIIIKSILLLVIARD